MRIQTSFAAIAISSLMFAFGAQSPSAAAPITPLLKADAHAQLVQEVRQRRHSKRSAKRLTRRFYVPIAPNYSAYDYPYYFARGYYPTHIGPGYIYYGRPYSYYRSPYAYGGGPYLPYQHRGYIRHGWRPGRF